MDSSVGINFNHQANYGNGMKFSNQVDSSNEVNFDNTMGYGNDAHCKFQMEYAGEGLLSDGVANSGATSVAYSFSDTSSEHPIGRYESSLTSNETAMQELSLVDELRTQGQFVELTSHGKYHEPRVLRHDGTVYRQQGHGE